MKKSLLSLFFNCNSNILIVSWIVIVCIQAYITPIHYDEAYYWMFSKELAWGYFDHPPLVALFIYISDIIFNGILSIRFITIISHIISAILIYKTIDFSSVNVDPSKRINLYFCFFILMPLFHVFSFITTPDVPLILAVSLFFYSYKRTLKENNIWLFLVLGFSMALMLYAKYHGALVIIFTLLSNIKLLQNPKYYISGFFALGLFIPHVYWQYSFDFISINYHLTERITRFSWSFPVEYLFNLLIVFNPFLILFLFKIIRNKWKNAFQKALYFTMIGFITFFIYQSFKVRIQPQWLIACYIPFLILLIENWNQVDLKRLNWSLVFSLPLLIILHVMLAFDIVDGDLGVHRNKAYANKIHTDANGKSVMFKNSYRRASLYTWYTDQKYTHSYNSSSGRKNQFNLWYNDSIFHEEEIFFVGMYEPGKDPIYYDEPEFYGNSVLYKPSDKLKVYPLKHALNGDSIIIEAIIENPYRFEIDFSTNYKLAVKSFYADYSSITSILINSKVSPFSSEFVTVQLAIEEGRVPDKIGICASHKSLPYGSVYFPIMIEN